MENKKEYISCLKNWIVFFVKHKDIISISIQSIEEDKDSFDVIVTYKDKKQFIITIPFITEFPKQLSNLKETDNIFLVLFNNKKNLDFLFKNWKELSKFQNLSVFFVNPFSKTETKWIIVPHTHNRICDEKSLLSGLKSMQEQVEIIDENKLDSNVKKYLEEL